MITKQAIFNAAYGLMERKDIDKITVTDIVKECHITRQTFYYHFQDIVAMMEWGLQQEIDQLVKKAATSQTMEEALLNFFNVVMERKSLFCKIMNSRYYQQGLLMMADGLKRYLVNLAYLSAENVNRPVKDMIFLLDYHVGAITVMMARWMQSKNVDMENEVQQISKIIKASLCI